MQPCWTCKKCYGGCNWSKRFEPVPGWDATPTNKGTPGNGTGNYYESYDIHSCPEYENDGSLPPEERGRKLTAYILKGGKRIPQNVLSPEEERLRLDLYLRGMSDGEMAIKLGVSNKAIKAWRVRRKLEANAKKGGGRICGY